MRQGFAIALALACLALPVRDAQAWSARKTPPPHHAPSGHKSMKTQAIAPQATPLHDRVRAWAQEPKHSVRAGVKLLQEAVTARQAADVRVLAEALAEAPDVPVSLLVDAATALAQGQDDPVQRKLWQRAWQAGRNDRALGRLIAEGYADALVAAGQPEAARKVVLAALQKTPKGQRRTLLDRLVALGRVGGDLPAVVEELRAWEDPDALVLAAQIQTELGDDEAALQTLRNAWKSFPGHRGLQAAYTGLLARTGAREELAQVVAQVVRLAPADPMPWLAVLDAHIAARDTTKARALIDDLARKNPRHDALLEALIDREQRLGDETDRLAKLYDALLKAAPGEAQYIEAYAEWLLGRNEIDAARAVLARLRKLKGGEFEGLQREATLLLAHNRLQEARQTAERMEQLKPGDLRVIRLLAVWFDRVGKPQEAEARWLELARLGDAPTPGDRSRALEARQALAALYRRLGFLPQRAQAIAMKLQGNPMPLGDALLYLDLYAQLDRAPTAAEETTWLALALRLRERFSKDPEALHALAAGLLQAGRATEAVPVLEDLARIDPDGAEPLLAGLAESALARGDAAMVKKVEALLLREGGGQPPQTSVLLKLGDVHLRFGDTEGAAALFRRAAAASPHDTRATARLATLFRLAGADIEESRALRDIVLHATDADELDAAGQRLLTLALGEGRSGELVRWLDTVMPQHPRRDMLERFRIAAYDAWLRTAALDRQLGRTDPVPAPSPVGDALTSGDLALQVRALRQLAALGRPVPTMVAKQLLHHDSAVLRRDTALAIGIAGTQGGAVALVDVMAEGADQDDEVVRAQLAALSGLPHVPGVEAVLSGLLGRPDPGAMAALVLGHLGAEGTLPELAHMTSATRRDVQPAALMAIGAILGQKQGIPQAPLGLTALLDASPLAPGNWPATDFLKPAAALWGMAAASHRHTRDELLQVALRAESHTLQAMALALLAAPQRPELAPAAVQPGDSEGLRDLRGMVIRRTLAPWLLEDADAQRQALRKLDTELAGAWPTAGQTVGTAARWCEQWRDLLARDARLAERCAAPGR
jgi:tetratricopeptide (TPR) repeat protein